MLGIGLSPVTSFSSPASLSLTGWWRANYSGAPWIGSQSAGTSGINNLTSVGVNPTVGTSQNGYDPASFTAASAHELGSTAISTYITAGAGTVIVLVRPSLADATAGVFSDPGYWADSGGNIVMTFSSSGLGVGIYDGSQKTIVTACTTDEYHLLAMRWNGIVLESCVDSGAWSNVACGNIGSVAGTLAVGKNPGVAFQTFRMLEMIMMSTNTTDTVVKAIKTYFNRRYNLAL